MDAIYLLFFAALVAVTLLFGFMCDRLADKRRTRDRT
jgi:hypothetical protein